MKSHALRDALGQLADTGEAPPWVRTEIAESWSRSLRRGLDPERLNVPAAPEAPAESAPMHAAVGVLNGLADDLEGEEIGILLTDAQGGVVGRWAGGRRVRNDLDRISLAPGFGYGEPAVGTNAIGSALERRSPAYVSGQEHFVDVLTTMACGASPFLDPTTGRLVGIVDLSCRVGDGTPLLMTLARRAAREVSAQLARALDGDDRVLWERFLELRRGAKVPLAVVNHRRALYNAAAERLFRHSDHTELWSRATAAMAGNGSGPHRLPLASGSDVEATCEALWAGGQIIGVVWRVVPAVEDGAAGLLTATELSVVSLVVDGLTNRQVADRLFMSRFTVDSHLRSVYRKLGVASRLELARSM